MVCCRPARHTGLSALVRSPGNVGPVRQTRGRQAPGQQAPGGRDGLRAGPADRTGGASPGQLGGGRLHRLRGAHVALLLAAIIALAFNLRAAITSLPPVFPELAATLHISTATEAALAAVPVLCFGVFSGIAAPLSRAFGEERVLGAALVLLAAGLLLRSAAPHLMLFPGTIVASGAIALMNVLLPSLIKRRRPQQAGLLIGLYLSALSAGAILGSLVAVPVFVAAGGAGLAVRVTLGMWALPALLAAVIWAPQLRYRTLPGPVVEPETEPQSRPQALAPDPPAQLAGQGETRSPAQPSGQPEARSAAARSAAELPARRRGVLSMARYPLAWQVTLFMGLQSLSYYAALSWFPTLFRDRGMSAVHAGDLLALMNLGNAVTAMLVPVLAHRARDQRMITAVSMLATAGGLAGAAFGPLAAAAPFMFLLGLGQGATLGLGIFYTMARAPDPVTAASLSAFAQGIGYLIASTGPLLLGYLHAVSGGWTIPVIALLIVAVAQLITGWLAGRALTVPALGLAPPRAAPRPVS
jgi:CP family cyanate transporter-like MFS transporter